MNEPFQPSLGVVAICRNEERDLPAFLQNVLLWVDELVLVDDGSTDRTVEIARQAGAKVKLVLSPRQGTEGYVSQRNKGIDAAASDWILQMDIDERVSSELRRSILDSIQLGEKDAYSYHRLNFFLHRRIRWGTWGLYRSVRLARRGLRFEGAVHERMNLPKHRIGKLTGSMWHFNETTYELRIRKNLGYALINAQAAIVRGKRMTPWEILYRPPYVFCRNYFLLLGFRDGMPGLLLALRDFAATIDFNGLIWDAQNRVSREEIEAAFVAAEKSSAP